MIILLKIIQKDNENYILEIANNLSVTLFDCNGNEVNKEIFKELIEPEISKFKCAKDLLYNTFRSMPFNYYLMKSFKSAHGTLDSYDLVKLIEYNNKYYISIDNIDGKESNNANVNFIEVDFKSRVFIKLSDESSKHVIDLLEQVNKQKSIIREADYSITNINNKLLNYYLELYSMWNKNRSEDL